MNEKELKRKIEEMLHSLHNIEYLKKIYDVVHMFFIKD